MFVFDEDPSGSVAFVVTMQRSPHIAHGTNSLSAEYLTFWEAYVRIVRITLNNFLHHDTVVKLQDKDSDIDS